MSAVQKMPEFVISGIKPDWLDRFWQVISDDIQRAVEHSNGELSLCSLYEKVKSGEMMLLIVSDTSGEIYASCLIETRHFSTGKRVLNVTTLNGYSMGLWLDDLMDVLRKTAKEFECSEIYAVGRSGWVKQLKKYGFKPVHQVVSVGV